MINKKILNATGAGLIGLTLLGACGGHKENDSSNYAPGTIKGRSPPATIKTITLPEITQDDIGSYVIAHYNNKELKDGSLVHPEDNKVIVYSSRMNAMDALFKMREQHPREILDLIQIIRQNYDKSKREGGLNGLH